MPKFSFRLALWNIASTMEPPLIDYGVLDTLDS